MKTNKKIINFVIYIRTARNDKPSKTLIEQKEDMKKVSIKNGFIMK